MKYQLEVQTVNVSDLGNHNGCGVARIDADTKKEAGRLKRDIKSGKHGLKNAIYDRKYAIIINRKSDEGYQLGWGY